MLDTPFAVGQRQRASSSNSANKRAQPEQLSSATRKQRHRRRDASSSAQPVGKRSHTSTTSMRSRVVVLRSLPDAQLVTT